MEDERSPADSCRGFRGNGGTVRGALMEEGDDELPGVLVVDVERGSVDPPDER